MLVAGTADPISPYSGDLLSLFGKPRGLVESAVGTAETFARCNGLPAAAPPMPLATAPTAAGGLPVIRRTWFQGKRALIELYAVQGGGHAVPQAAFRFPRILGATATNFDVPRQALLFFGLLPAGDATR